MVVVCELPPMVALTVALASLVIVPAAVAVKFAVVAPSPTETEEGTVSELLLLESVTLEPPLGAAWGSVTVQLAAAPGPRLAGLHATLETDPPAPTLVTLIVCELTAEFTSTAFPLESAPSVLDI